MNELKVVLVSFFLFLLFISVSVVVHEFGHTVIPAVRGCEYKVIFDIFNISSYKNISFDSPVAHVETSGCYLSRKDINYTYINGPVTEILYYLIVLSLLFIVYMFVELKYDNDELNAVVIILMVSIFVMMFSSFLLWFVFKFGDLGMLV